VALGPGAGAAASELAAAGADTVYVSEDAAFEGWPADAVAAGLAQIAEQTGAAVVLVGSTRRGKETAPRLAQKLGAGCVTDVNDLVAEGGELVAGRYAFGGATVAREKVGTAVKVFAVMPKTFAAEGATPGAGTVETPTLDVKSSVKVVDRRAKEGDHVNLDAAPLIVGVGRGFNAREDLGLADELAGALGAVVGCTKSLADFEWLGEDRVIGLSGAKTAPDLYLSVGISGQIQHTVGVAGAKLIAAVNKDKEAPIFAMADYGLVGDLYEVVPALVERLKGV
jgi:electron transfer flavoprotein alpha subunit